MSTIEFTPEIGEAFPKSDAPAYRQPATTCANVGAMERGLSVLAGLGLVALGSKRSSILGLGLPLLGGGALIYRGLSGFCPLYDALGIDRSQQHSENLGVAAGRGCKFEGSVIINRPAAELYRAWKSFDALSAVIDHLESVTPLDDKRSRWRARGPVDRPIQWDAEIFNDTEGQLIAWRSIPPSEVDTAGSVRFETLDGDRGTVVRLSLKYDPPGGKSAVLIAKLLGPNVDHELRSGLSRWKQLMEAGELASIDGQSQGTCHECQ